MIDTLQKYKYLSLVCLVLVVLIASFNAPQIQVDTNIAQFFHEDDSDFRFYQKVKSEIPDNEGLILLGVKSKDSVFNIKFLEKIKALQDSLKKVEEIKNVRSLLNLSYPARSMFGLIAVPFLDIKDSIINYKKEKILGDELSRDFISQNGNAMLLLLEINDSISSEKSENTVVNINRVLTHFNEIETHLWGRKIIDVSFKNILISEIFKFSFWIFIFLCVSLISIFKKPIAILFPILLVLIIIAIFLGGMVIINKPISTLSNLFPTIILIVAVSDVIHLCIKYDLEWKKGRSALIATRNTLKEIGWTTLVTSFTTAVGFSVLFLSPMKAIKNFGIESAFLVLITYALTLIYLPIVFTQFKSKNIFAVRHSFNAFSANVYEIQRKLFKYPKSVLIIFGLILMFTIFGITRINMNRSHFSIPKNTDLHNSFKFFETNFRGSRTFELVLASKNKKTLNEPSNLKSVYKIHKYLALHPKLNSVKSPVSYYKTLHKAYYPSTYNNRTLPLDKKTIKKYDKDLAQVITKDYLSNKEKTIFKFNAQMQDLGSLETERLNEEILNEINSIIRDQAIEARFSGIDLLIDISQKKSIENTFYGLLIAILVVSLTLGLIFSNITLALLAVILNLVPLVMTAGIMGFTSIELRAEIALIFTIGFVIAVDDTIHLLSKFQWERKQGKSVEEAIQISVRDCGKAILATSIILVGGFFILLSSNQLEIYMLSLLIAIIVIITLFVDLIIAPIIILRWFTKYI